MMDFGDLESDEKIKTKLKNISTSVAKLERIVEMALSDGVSKNLNVQNQMKYDAFMAFTLNSLYWIYLRTKGINPNNNEVKQQLIRIKDYMNRVEVAIERHTKRSTVDQEAAERFIRHGLGCSKKKTANEGSDEPAAKKVRKG